LEIAVSGLPECPEIECCAALLNDAMPTEQRAWYEQHLEECATCQARLDSLESGTDLLDLVREVGDSEDGAADSALTQVLEQLHAEKTPESGEPADLYFVSPSDREDVLGTLGSYEVQDVIGQGGMGVVLKAYEPALHRLVAIKVMSPAVAGSATARRRFTREAQSAAAVCHDNIVAVHAVHEIDGLPYLVMQYVGGESLQQRIERSGPLELVEIVRIGLQTASGLAAAHAQGLIHRDIKPANLLLENGLARVKITDFGLARTADDVQLTQQGVVAGTPEYMAPEQARGEPIDHRADLFSLGSVLYAMSTGAPPFQAGTAVAVLRKVSDLTPPPIRVLNPEMTPWLERLISRLMAKNPAERFQGAEEVARLLEGYLAHLQQPTQIAAPELPPATSAEQSSESSPAAPLVAPHPVWVPGVIVWAAMLVLGIGTAGWLLAAGGKDNDSDVTHEYMHSFLGDTGNSQGLELFGPGADQCVKFEAEGLRITVPTALNEQSGTGIRTGAVIKGDFEITAGFEVLREPVGAKARLSLVILYEKPAGNYNMATLSRSVGPQARHFASWFTLRDDNADQNRQRFHTFPTTAMKGQLRLIRTGSVLSFSAAEEGQPFTLLKQYPFTREDLEDVRLTGMASGGEGVLDFRFTDLRIWGDALRNLPSSRGLGGSTWPLLLLGLLLVLAGTGAWIYVRKSRCKRRPTALEGEAEGQIPPQRTSADGASESPPGALRPTAVPWTNIYLWLPPLAFLLVLGSGLVMAHLPQAHGELNGPEFSHDFRGQPLPAGFTLYGEPEGKFVKSEPEGLRITIPDSWTHPRGGVGLLSNFGFRGDFEVTTTVEILHADEPQEGWGVGAGIRINMADPHGPGATIVHLSRAGIGEVIFWDRWMKAPGNQDDDTDKGVVPCKDHLLRLRLKRTGSTLSYLWAPGKDGADFQEIHHCKVATDDVQSLRLSALTGRLPYNVDVRFLNLRIRSSGLVAGPFRWRLWLAAALLVLVITCGLSGLLYARQKGKAKMGLVPERRHDAAEPPASPPAVYYPCTACGKTLKVLPASVGKKVKCPGCGAASVVPGAERFTAAPGQMPR
jgi:serine/threonine protein kinase